MWKLRKLSNENEENKWVTVMLVTEMMAYETNCFKLFLNVLICMEQNMFKVKLKTLNVKSKMGNGEFHHLRNWFCNSRDIEIFSEPIVLLSHFLEKFQSVAYEASNYSKLLFDSDCNDNKFSPFLFVNNEAFWTRFVRVLSYLYFLHYVEFEHSFVNPTFGLIE